MVVYEINGVKRKWENRDFSSDCSNKPKYKRRKVSARRDFPKGFTQNAAKVENVESEYKPKELEDDVLSQPICEPPEILYARNDYPVLFYHVARKVFAKRDFPEAFYANSRRVEREESESEQEEPEEAIGSDDDKTEESICESYNVTKPMGFEPIFSVGKMGLSESVNNQIVGSTKLVDSNRMMSGAGEELGDYVQHMLAFLDHMKATLMQKYSRKISAV